MVQILFLCGGGWRLVADNKINGNRKYNVAKLEIDASYEYVFLLNGIY